MQLFKDYKIPDKPVYRKEPEKQTESRLLLF